MASELIKLFDTAIRTPPYDWFGLSLQYTVYPQSGLKISIELMFEFSQVSVPMIMSGLVEWMTCSNSMVLFLTDWKFMFKTLSGRLKEFGLSLLGAVFVVLLGVEVWMGSGGRGDLSVVENLNQLP